jgi:hypothetical protein
MRAVNPERVGTTDALVRPLNRRVIPGQGVSPLKSERVEMPGIPDPRGSRIIAGD